MVYGRGLRRCLIIFDPHTHILDRRTRTCRTPSPPQILQRSKNFTSGVAVSFTLSDSIVDDRCMPRTGASGGRVRRPTRTPEGIRAAGPHTPPPPGYSTRFPRTSTKASTTPCHVRSMLRHSMDEHSAGRAGHFEHTEFSTVSQRWAPVADQGSLHGAGPCPLLRPGKRAVHMPRRSPLKETWSRSGSHRS